MVNQSDVARLRQQIEQECRAMQQAMTGFAATASHTIIHQRYANIEVAHQQLTRLVGEEEATTIMVTAYTELVV